LNALPAPGPFTLVSLFVKVQFATREVVSYRKRPPASLIAVLPSKMQPSTADRE